MTNGPRVRFATRHVRFPFWALAGVLVLAGCSTGQYRKSADAEVYGIIQSVEQQVFGYTNAFNIDTAYSHREPDAIQPPELIEDRVRTNNRLLTVEDALELAVGNSREYQTRREQLYLAALALSDQRYRFGPQFFARSDATAYEGNAAGQGSAGIANQLGFNQALKSGGSIGLSFLNRLTHYYGGSPQDQILNALTLSLFQPLMRNAGRYNPARENLTQAERNVIYEVRSFALFQDQFAVGIVNDYFTLLAQKDVIRNNYTNYLSQVRSTKRLEARARDRELRSQVDIASQSELAAKDRYVNSVASYRNSLDRFKLTLGLPISETIHLDDHALEELRQAELIPAPIDRDRAFHLALDIHPELLNAIDQFDDAKRAIKVAINQLLPKVDLEGDVTFSSSDENEFVDFDVKKARYSVGIGLDLPIDRLNERNSYRRSLISFEREIRNLSLTLDDRQDRLDRGLRTLEQRRQNYLIQRNALELANRRVRSDTLSVEAGRVEPWVLVDSQNAQLDTQNGVIAALISYQQTRLQLLLDVGILDSSREHFWLLEQLDLYPVLVAQEWAPRDLPREDIQPPDRIFSN